MNRSLLEQPFEAGQIKQRRGPYGPLDYVEGHSVTARLNQALEGAWSFEIVHHEIREDEVIVLGKLTAENIVKSQFGVSQITRKEGGAIVSLGDDLKAATTDWAGRGGGSEKACSRQTGPLCRLRSSDDVRPDRHGLASSPSPPDIVTSRAVFGRKDSGDYRVPLHVPAPRALLRQPDRAKLLVQEGQFARRSEDRLRPVHR